MSYRTFYRRILLMIFLAGSISLCFFVRKEINKNIPDDLMMSIDSKETIPISFGKDIVVTGDKVGSYVVDVKLFGLIYLKSIDVKVIDDTEVYPGGSVIGMYLQTEGVMVVGAGEVYDAEGIKHEPALSLVKAGDYITALNDIDVSSKSQLVFLVNKYGKENIKLTIKRENEMFDINIKPVQTGKEEYKLGIWVRDDTQGIGTVTYVTKDGFFGALGHGVSDADTGKLLDSRGGRLYKSNIWGIEKGLPGEPGGLCGYISYEDTNILGEIHENCSKGIYGVITAEISDVCSADIMKIGFKQDVKTGTAYIYSCLSGEPEYYEIIIEKININNSDNKNMVLKVTDEELLEATGGIVQGMSGSPIIQNGRIVGAVTHVLVNDPTRGYGIFIENMLEH